MVDARFDYWIDIKKKPVRSNMVRNCDMGKPSQKKEALTVESEREYGLMGCYMVIYKLLY